MARAGRMNAQGISVFYGATRARVGIAEVGPPVGSRVTVARFDIIRRLPLFDLTALEKVYEQGSIFDRSRIRRLERAAFLRSVSARMVRPIAYAMSSFVAGKRMRRQTDCSVDFECPMLS